MSIEDLNISAVDADQAVTEFSSEFQADGQQTADIEVAQAIEDAAAAKSDRLPPEAAPVAERPKDVVPDQNNIARLPANVTVDEIRVEGANLILVQADGTEVTVINGALRIPTFIIGDVEVPQQVLLAVLEQDGVNVAAGPDGSYSATSSGPQSSGGDFNDSLQQSTQEAGPLADLLANTELDDPNGDGGGLLFDDTPIITETALNFITETANAAGTFESQSLDGIFGFVPGRDTGQIASIAYVNTLNVDEPAQTGTVTALTSGGVPVVVTASPDGLTLTGTAGGVVVFTLTVTDTATGAFTFQQLHALDHPDQGQRGAEDLLRLQFTYTVTDKDGDTVIGNASIDIQDDGPVANAGTASTVEDEAVNGGNNQVDGLAAGVSGVSLNINWGADSANAGGLNDRSVAFTNTTVAVSGASSTALTSLGLAVSTVLINGVLVGYTGETAPTAVTGEGSGNVVFFASVSDVANGTYDFTLVKPLDHAAGNGENSLSLTFNYTATDSDGDTSSNTFSVNVIDDAPVAAAGTASTVEDEAVNGGNNEVDGLAAGVSGVSLNINWGSDNANAGGLNDRSVAFTNTTVAVSGASSTALTSLGLAVSTVLINGVLVGYTGETAPTAVTGEGSGNVVFFASVSDVANGTYDFTLVKPLDHAAGNGENSLSLTFNYTATDSDGDTSSNTFSVNVVDDAPVAAAGTASTVEDEAVNGGNNEVDGLAAGVSGVSLNINWGSDNANAGGLNDRSVAFTNTTVAVSGASSTALTSLGLAVSTVLINGVLVGYTGETAPTAVTGEGSGNVVFFASVSDVANGTYDFTLVKPLDHAAGNGENSLSLTFNYTATDSDGDTSSNTFSVNVVDDAPVAAAGTASTVEDVAVNGGNNEVDGLAAGVSGVSLNINWGSDNANAGGLNDRSVAFTNTTVAVSGASSTALTSLGLAVSTVLINGVLVGYTGETAPTAVTGEGSGNVVFFASVSDVANGTYDFTLVKPLDHAAGNGENSLSLTFNYTATDSDGDTSSNTFSVNVIDDAPVAAAGTASTVEDEAVNGGNNEVDGLAAGVSGVSLNINWGSDNANAGGLNDRSVAFTNTTVAVSGASSTALTSLGLAVSTVLINGVLVGYTGETAPTAVTGEGSGNVVFFASVSDVANGTYDFTLVKPLDHAAGNGENSLSLTFNYTATDSDGDTSSNTFSVNVIDDAPVAAAGTASTVEDEAVNGGNNEVDGLAAGVSGVSLNIKWGSDNANAGGLNDRSVAFTNTTVAVSGASSTALTSLGLAVSTVLINGVLVGYTGETAPTAVTGEGSGNVVFFASVSDVANGTYDFTLVKPLDHAAGNGENSLSLTFNYTATDSDGDTSSNTFSVNVIDDAPVAAAGTASTVEDEAVNGGNNEVDGLAAGVSGVSLNINWGSDNANAGGLNDRSVAFTNTTVAVSGASSTALTSLGLAVSTVLINGVLVGYTGETAPTAVTGEGSGNVVFFASVSDVANGTYDFTLVKPLDHAAGNGENSLSLTFNYTATDSDGDTSSNTFSVNVVDDILVLTGTSVSVTVDEDDILNLRSQGTSPNDGTADGSSSEFAVLGGGFAATVSGSVAATVAFGADGQRAGGGFSFTSTAVSTLNGLGLTSNGGAVVFAIVDGAIVGYVNGAFGGFQPLIDRPVLSLELNETTGAFTFRQYDQLDHQAGNGQNTTLANGLASINFGAVINATDGDGDVVNLSGKLLITVRDDVPEVSISTVGSVTIDETSGNQNDDTTSSSVRNLFNGVAVKGLDADMGGAIYARHDVVDTSVNGGADDIVTSSLMLRIDNEVSGLFTTEGQAITLSLEGGLVVGRVASGEAAFAVAIQPNGNVSVVQYMSLQHPNTGSTDESINLTGKISAVFTATDSDGDVVSKSVSIGDKVNFDDDGPVLTGTSISVTIDEDDILNLRSQGTSPNDGTADGSSSEFAVLGGGFAATVSGSVAATVAFGADGQRAGGGFSFTSTAVSTLNGLGLTSNGGAVVFAIVDGAIVGYVNGAFGGFQPLIDRPVLSLELNETTGAFTFRQYDQLDHQAGNGQNTTLANGLASINFGAVINATDGDGDVVNLSGKLLITVRDDVPEVSISTVGSVTIDETSGNQNDDTTSSSVRNLFNGVAVKGLDADMGGAIYARHDVVDTSVNGGADDIVTSSLMLRIDNEVSGLFTTEGQAITLSLEGGLVVGRVASGEAAFAVAIQPNGNVSVVQYMSLQHPNTGSTDESINLTGKISAVFTATDSDGDVVSKSVSIGDKVNFDDDGPRVSANTLVQIDEDTLAGGNPGGNLDDVDNVAATGTLAHDSGADGTASILWSAAGLTLPSGFWFSVSVDGTVMTITQLQGGVYVPVVTATITNTATGAYSVAQVAPIDHPQGTIPGTEDNVQFTVSYDVTDGDGDQVRGTLSINVDDDTPTVGQNTMMQLDDDALVGGNPGGVGDEAETAVLTGVLSHSGGADGTASVLWAPNGLTLPNGFWYDLSADSKMMTITQLQNGSYVGVFKVVITDPATGAYLVTQLAPVNHNTIGTEDNAEVSFQYRVTDGDGDVATGTLTVNIDDDTPTLTQTLRYNDVYEAGVGAATGTDSSTFAVNYGADGYGATAFTGALKLDIGGGLAGNVNLNLANGPDSSAKFTSEGRVIVFTMVDANTIRGVAGNELIIEIKLTDTDSSAKTTLYGNIDHIAAQNGAAIDRLVVDATVKFTDGDGDAVTGIIRSTIHDEAPVAIGPAQAGTLSEAGLPFVSSTFASLNIDIGADNKNTHVGIGLNSNGRFIDDGLTSDGVPLQYIVRTANGVDQELVAFKQGDTEANPVFIVAVLHPGSFAATLYQNVDHLGGNDTNLALHLTARVYDGDGDFVDQPFTINIADSVPTLTQTLRYNDVYEAGVGAATGTDSSTFAVNYGADGYGATAFTGALKLDIGGGLAGNVNLNLANGPDSSAKFTSEGRVIVFTMVDANTIRGVAGNELIIEIKLTDTDSSAKTTLYGNIDHIAAQNGAAIDRLVVDATVKFTDGDGDAVTGIIRSTIHDEAPVAIGPAQTGTLSETGLPFVSSTFGSLNIDLGADYRNSHVSIGLNGNGTPIINAGLTSDGVALEYLVRTTNGVDQELVAFKQGDPAGAANPVFVVSVLHNGSFAATLYQNFDHANGSDSLTLNMSARVYDGDGDYVDQSFKIDIQDDLPTAAYSGNVVVTENASGTVFMPQTASGRFIFDGGADGAKVTSLAYGAGSNATGILAYDADAAGPGVTRVPLTSAGRPISVETSADGLTLTGKTASGVTVFTLHVDNAATGEYTFKQFAAIDHPDVNEAGAADPLRMRINFTVTDGDGDQASGHIQVDIRDDAPVINGAAQSGNLSEAGLASGISLVSGSLNIDVGADYRNGHVSIGLNGNGKPIINAGLTSDGVALDYIVRTTNGVDQELVAFKHGDVAGAANPVFIVSVLHPASFVAVLYQNVDHLGGDDASLVLNLSARIYDGDGDYVDQPFTISIADTVPVLVSGTSVSGDVAEGTLALDTQTFASGTINQAIPDLATITSSIVVPTGGTIQDLNVSINLHHTFMSDLEITLIAPDGTRVILVNNNGSSGDPNGVIKFDDEAANSFTSASAPFVGTWRPTTSALSLLDGKDMSGTWKLEIKDETGADVGTLRDWGLEIQSLQVVGTSSTNVNLSSLVSVGADDINGGAAFSLKTISTAENLGTVMAGGHQVKIVSDGTTLTGYADGAPGTPLFTLKVSATGVATFVLIGELDHGVGNNTLRLDLGAYVQAADGDHDVVTIGGGRFFVNVADSLPTATDVTAAMGENESKSVTLIEGVHFNFGADEIGTAFSFGTPSYTGLPVGITLGTPAITFDTINHKISIVPGTAFDVLAAGQTVVMHIPYTVADGDGDTVIKDIAITITGTNDIPVIDLSTTTAGNDASTNAVEQTAQQFAWQADLSDVDSPNLTSMTLTLGNILDGASETLSLNGAATAAAVGLTVTFNAGVLQITGPASVDRYETILKNTIYLNSSDNPHVAIDRTVTVIVNDGIANSAPQVATIHLIALNDAPVLAGPLTDTVAEGAILTLTSAKLGYTDPDNGPTEVVFRVSNVLHGVITNGGAPATSFTAQELNSGLIKFTHDGSEGPTASFNVAVEDGNQDGSAPVAGTFNLTVTQVNDIPVISSGSTGSEAENSAISHVVYQTVASDVDPGASLTYSLTGVDAARFDISSTGGVTFKASPNFEAPSDNGGNNVYDIIVNVTDGASAAVTKAVVISVTNVNEAPVITSGATGTEAENTAISNVVYQTVASDPEGVALTYTLTGADANLFNISSTGAVTFKASPNFEAPSDNGGNNVYNFTVNASDGVNPAATKDVAVTVTDVAENIAPVGVSDRIYTNASSAGSGTNVDVMHAWLLKNDTDANGDALSMSSFSWANNSGVEIVQASAFDNGDTRIVVDLNQGGSGLFRYTATDGSASTSNVDVSVLRSSDSESILGSNGDDILIDTRSSGAVTLDGGAGRDFIIGGGSDDTIIGDQNDYLISGGGGTDTVRVASSFTSAGDAQIVGVEAFTLTTGTTLNLANQTEGFKILGSSGIDTITGGAGNDTINGGGGNDIINLSASNADRDQIRFATNTGSDTVNGFITGQDKIGLLDGSIFGPGPGAVAFLSTIGSSAGAGLSSNDFGKAASIASVGFSPVSQVIAITSAQTEAQILSGSASISNSYVVVYNSNAGAAQIWFDTDWSNAGSRSLIATLNGVTAAQVAALTSSDFVAYNSATDPIILDLDHNGFAFSSIEHGVTFDIDADGRADKIAWTKDDAILAYDVDGNGKIDNGSEIFTPSFNGGNHAGGVAALATLDSNGDGKIDAQDATYSKLSVWIDANNNGISDAGELSSLLDHHIASISLGVTVVDGQQDGQAVLAEGTFTLDNGSTGNFIEVGFDTISGDGTFGTAGDDILAAGLGHYSMTGGAGADTFVLDADAFKGIELADVITDYKAGEGDVLDVSNLLTSLLGHEASEADALANVKTTVNGADTVVSVNDNGAWHDVAVLQDYTSTVKVLYDDDHNTTSASHSV